MPKPYRPAAIQVQTEGRARIRRLADAAPLADPDWARMALRLVHLWRRVRRAR
jgi:hypothetical protein